MGARQERYINQDEDYLEKSIKFYHIARIDKLNLYIDEYWCKRQAPILPIHQD